MKAYLDTLTGSILSVEDWKARGLGAFQEDMDLEPIYKGHGQGIAFECMLCFAPIGSKDPEKAAYVILGVCCDCNW
jgi:hypothetical protein